MYSYRPLLSNTPSLTILKLSISAPSSKILTDVGGIEPVGTLAAREGTAKFSGRVDGLAVHETVRSDEHTWKNSPDVGMVSSRGGEEDDLVCLLVEYWRDESNIR
jgi:hypothetical protein